jgi:hypothetical protein
MSAIKTAARNWYARNICAPFPYEPEANLSPLDIVDNRR